MADGLDREELAREYGWSVAFFRSDPELWKLFNQAVSGHWTADKFGAELRDTNWFQTKPASYRQYLANKFLDPATWQSDYDRTYAMIHDAYGALWGTTMPPKLAGVWTQRAMMFGWSEAQIRDHIVGAMNAQHQIFQAGVGGQAADLKGQIQAQVAAYGVEPSNRWIANQIKQIMLGNDTVDGAVDQIKSWAEKRYSAFADQIKGGRTVQDIAEPYMQTMAQLLELDPGQLDVNSKLIQQALTRTVQDEKTGQSKQVPLSLTAFQDMVRNDPRWTKTQQAHDQFGAVAANLLRSWGLVA